MNRNRLRLASLCCITLSVFFLPDLVVAQGQPPQDWVKSNLRKLTRLYVHFHRNPELSFDEKETAAKLGKELETIGAKVTYNVGGYGVVGMIENGPGPTVMLRTDLDALPVTETTPLPFACVKKVKDAAGNEVGVMHACGHDVHMTSLVGAARYLVASRDLWSGRLMLIGQPAEERGAGALAMLDAGLFTRFAKPDYAIALHCHSVSPSGSVSIRGGYAMANVDSVDIEVFGRGGHGAYPHTTIDPIVQAAKLILDIQTIVSREIKPIEPAVITVGSIHAGTKHNVISGNCKLQLTVRSYSHEVRRQLLDGIRRKAKAAAISVGAKEPVISVSEGTPSLSNDQPLAAQMADVFRQQIGDENVLVAEPVMGGEDFSHFGRRGIPSLMFFLGVVEQPRLDRYQQMGITPPSLHSSDFYPDVERTLQTGVVTMASAVLDLLKKEN